VLVAAVCGSAACVELSGLGGLEFGEEAPNGLSSASGGESSGGATTPAASGAGGGGVGGGAGPGAGGSASASTGAGGGGVGGQPVACDDVVFADDFNDGVLAAAWAPYTENGTISIDETGGELVIVAQEGSQADALIQTPALLDLSVGELTIELVQASESSDLGHVFFAFTLESGEYLSFRKEQGLLKLTTDVPSYTILHQESYSAVNHRFLRFRRDGATTHVETSPDASGWDSFHSLNQDNLFSADDVRIILGVFAAGDGITARFDNVVLCH
jgi:hypothetical protein